MWGAAKEEAVFRVGGVMPSKGDGGRATDTFRPHHAYEQRRNTENRQRLRGLATASLMPPLRHLAVPPCSLRRCMIRILPSAQPLAVLTLHHSA